MFVNLSLAETAIEFVQTILDLWNKSYTKVVTILTTSPSELYPEAWTTMGNVAGYLASIGAALLIVFFYIGLTKTTLHFEELRRPERFIGPVVRLVIGEALVINGYTLLLKVLEIFQGIINGVFQITGDAGDSGQVAKIPDELVQSVGQLDTGQSILILLVGVLMGAIIWLLSVILVLLIYVRFFKIYIYAAVAPIPLSSVSGEGTSRIAKTFAMNYLGVCFQGVLIIIAFALFKSLAIDSYTIDPNLSTLQNFMGFMGGVLLQMLLLVITVRTTEKLTKEMIGG